MFSFLCLPTVFCFCCLANSVEWVEHKGLWYYISDGEMVDYTAATAKCDFMNSHLAVITTEDQNDFIKSKTTDRIDRWIWLSNQESDHNSGPCELNSWFWNSDWNCSNDFNENEYLRSPAISECLAYTTNFGMWTLRYCTIQFGYICQWECKRFYLDLNYVDGNLSGIYEFHSYFNQHAVYAKSGSYNRIRIYRILSGDNNNWFIHDDDWRGYWRAKSSGDLYVPYDHRRAWTTIGGAGIVSSTFCIECASLLMCVSLPISALKSNCVSLYLNSTIPEYVNTEGNVFLKLHTNSQSCICSPTRTECGMNCGFIFPYPNETTDIVIGSDTAVSFTHICQAPQTTSTETPITEQYNTSTESRPQKPDNGKNINNVAAIVASSVTVVIIIIVLVVVVVVIILRKKRNKNKKAKSHPQSEGITNPRIGNMNNNVYVEQDGPKPVDSLKPAYAESSVDGHVHNTSCTEDHYTYIIDSANKDYSDSNDKYNYSKEKPVGGYLASDYGTLMNDHTKQDKPDPKSQTNDPPVYLEVKKTKYNKQVSNNDEKQNVLQIHENGIRLSDTENAADSRMRGQCEDNMSGNDCAYYNIERMDNADDDLELFENTVYNQT